MFYSQFILAKKGPLGTIWIAAHLERKLRKNQVADTDIGVSVDSILSPDVPIALRLSSHLLLGVVRIYNRKVNYLFDDCSEALLKVKQAFRSTAVDLPPEESKAPYHSITLPEKFDLDDFELPDSDIFQGNHVDHHISSREQITLQDTMEGVSYSMSKFGLDERFGDGDASGLDLDEELFLEKIGTAGDADVRVDAEASFGSTSALKQTQHSEDRAANLGSMIDGVPEGADFMDYAQAPRTPGLVEEPNLSKVASACDDQLESENHVSTVRENTNSAPHEDKQEIDWSSQDDIISDPVPQGPSRVNGYLSGGLEVESSNAQGQIESIKPSLEFTNEIIKPSDVPSKKDSPTEAASGDKTYFPSVDEARCNHQDADEIALEKCASRNSGMASTDQQVSERGSAKDLTAFGAEVPGSVGDTSNQQKSCHAGSELASENRVGYQQETPETQACSLTDPSALNLDAHDKEAASETLVLRPCDSIKECADVTKPGFSMSTDGDKKSDSNALATDGREETANLGEVYFVNGFPEQNLKENQVQEHASCEDIQVAASEADGLLHTMNSQDRLVENLNNSKESELPAPEKLLSVPGGHTDLHRGMMMEFSPGDFEKLDEGDAGSKTAAGKKRSFTESTLTEQSLNSIESSRQVRIKQATGSVPNDDDLLSSILVGRRSSILTVKPTPPLSEVTSMKHPRSAPRSSAPKRKMLMDDTMVLHGDMIRQQLTNPEDIRRVRKKAPCTLPEISMIQKKHMEDEIFLKPIFTDMSVELASLYGQVYDLSRIRVCQSEVNDASLEIVTEPRLPFQNDDNAISPETMVEPNLASNNEKSGADLETTPELHLTSANNRSYEMEDSKGPSLTNIIGVSGRGSNDEFLTVEDNETTEPREDPLLGENRLSIAFNFSEERTKTTNDVGANDSEQELSLNVSVVGTSLINAGAASPVIAEVDPLDSSGHATGYIGDASDGTVPRASLDESGQTNACASTCTAVVPDRKIAAPSVDFGFADFDDGQAIVRNEDTEKDGGAGGEGETEIGLKDDILLGVSQDAAAVEVVPNADHGELESNAQSEIYSTTSKEEVRFSCPGPVSMLQDCSMNNCENPDHQEAYQPSMMDEESGFDLHDRDELNYLAAENDTEFLNVDDDELTEMADDCMPEAEEAQYTENSGWSSRTRAVSKYLQSAFVKEAEHGRKSLSMDNLLNGKSRKEASRMFFEALVLKTRDYIHVEQRNPFDNITIISRPRLMKSGF